MLDRYAPLFTRGRRLPARRRRPPDLEIPRAPALHAASLAQRVFEIQFLSKPAILKQRFRKKYRHPTLDAKLTKSRLAGVRQLLFDALPSTEATAPPTMLFSGLYAPAE